jgi:hypothetical protein
MALCTGCSRDPAPPLPSAAQNDGAQRGALAASLTTAVTTNVAAPVLNVAPGSSGKPVDSPDGSAKEARASASKLEVKRFVVATGVKDREPVSGSDALLANGAAIYAFAELANPRGESENVRITFERKGGAERVGNVTLPVPGQVARHRTWATTRFIRAAGVWDAVLWSESGAELGRTSFEVSAS